MSTGNVDGDDSSQHPASWKPIAFAEQQGGYLAEQYFDEIRSQLSKERPDIRPTRKLIFDAYISQTGPDLRSDTVTDEQLREFARWIAFQKWHGNLDELFVRKWPRLETLLFATFSEKASTISQRPCSICHGARLIDDLFPIANYAIRITPISRQASRNGLFDRFQNAFKKRFQDRDFQIGKSGKLCLTMTFILDAKKADRDVDNMAKAAQDAFCRAVGINDRVVLHLDIAKLRFAKSEEWLYLRTAPSFLSENEDVMAPVVLQGWAGAERMEI